VPASPVSPGTPKRLRIAASDVSIAPNQPMASSILNAPPARVVAQSPHGSGEVTVVLALGEDGAGARVLARVTRRSLDLLALSEGMQVFAQVKGVSLVRESAAADGTPVPSARHGDCSTSKTSVGNPTRINSMSKNSAMNSAMNLPLDFTEIDPNRVAAIVYRPKDDVDALLAEFAQNLVRSGERIGGIVQRNVKDGGGCQVGMDAIDLMTGRAISICQPLGSGAMACKLDSAGLAEAAVAVAHAIQADVDLIVINKFSKQEAAGGGLRDELADAIAAGIPVLTAVPEKCLEAWKSFTGDIGTTLLCERPVIEGWWRDLSSRMARTREDHPRLESFATSRS
jgi:molybdate transport system ATP-binding protein